MNDDDDVVMTSDNKNHWREHIAWVSELGRERREEVIENWTMMNDDHVRMQSTARPVQMDN